MKKNIVLITMLAVLIFLAGSAQADDIDIYATVEITDPVSISAQTDTLDFGIILLDPVNDTVATMDATGVSTAGAAAVVVAAGSNSLPSGTTTAGHIVFASDIACSVSITYPGAVISLDDYSGSATATAGDVTIAAIAANSTASPISHSAGVNDDIFIGGELTIKQGTVAGVYTNISTPITVTVEVQ